jgi:hypothetical protein
LNAGCRPSRAASAVRTFEHGDVHPDEPRRGREQRPDEESERRTPAELVVEAEQEERHDRDDGDRRVLLAEVRRRALLDGARDLLHALVPGGLAQQPPDEVDPVQHRHGRAREREPDGVIHEEVHVPPVSSRYKVNARSPRRGGLCITSGSYEVAIVALRCR